MPTISAETLQFLTDLKAHNTKEWFTEHKPRYESAKKEFELFVTALIAQIARFDPAVAHFSAKDCIFRIYRDVRFSADKSPYKAHFGAHITPAASKSQIHTRAGYYVHLEPGASMLAGGAYMPEGPWLKSIRQEIRYNYSDFTAIIEDPAFKAYFGALEGEKLKRPPVDCPADHPGIEYLKQKSFLAVHRPSDAAIISSDFLSHCATVFKTLQPFDAFLNRSTD